MSEQTPAVQKLCTKCGESKNASLEFFHADPRASDKLYPQSKVCRKQKRTEALTPVEKKQLDRLDRREAAFNADLDNPNATANALRTAEIGVRKTIPKQRAELQKQIDERLRAVRAAELARQQSVELEKVRAEFPIPDVLPVGEERDGAIYTLEQKQAALHGDEFATARDYLQSQVTQLHGAIEAEEQAEAARIAAMEQTQDALDKAAGDKAAHAIFDWAKDYLLTPFLEVTKRKKLRTHCLEQAAKYQSATKDPSFDETGARNSVIATRMLRAYEKIARILEEVTQDSQFTEDYFTTGFAYSKVNWMFRNINERALLRHFTLLVIGQKYADTVPDAPEPIFNPKPPTEKLEHIQSRLDESRAMEPQLEEEETKRQAYWENLKNTDSKKYERDSRDAIRQVPGSGLLAQMQRERLTEFKRRDPVAYEDYCIALLEPRNFDLPTVVWLVPVYTHAKPKLPHKMMWGDGREVQQGEIVFDFRLKQWFLPAEPASVEINFKKDDGVPTDAQIGKMSPEAREFYRDKDSPTATRSSFAKPVKVTFKKADRHVAGSGRDNFRHGSWWSDEDVRRAETGWNPMPPVILPPLQLAVADSIAVKPESEAEKAKWKTPTETCWMRLERLRKEQEQREQELLN